MQRLSYPTEIILSNKISRNRIVLSFKDSPRNPLGRLPELGRPRREVCGGSHDEGDSGGCEHESDDWSYHHQLRQWETEALT